MIALGLHRDQWKAAKVALQQHVQFMERTAAGTPQQMHAARTALRTISNMLSDVADREVQQVRR